MGGTSPNTRDAWITNARSRFYVKALKGASSGEKDSRTDWPRTRVDAAERLEDGIRDEIGNMESVQLNFKYTEEEYLAAVRLFVWRSKETLVRLVVTYILITFGIILLPLLIDLGLPLWAPISLLLLVGIAFFHGFLVDLPRRYFRGDPKFRDEYSLSFSDEGIGFKTRNISASVAWSLYTGIIENESFYLLIYGKNIASVSIIPKRAFRDSKQEAAFREMVRRHIDHRLPMRQISDETSRESEYVPSSLEPPDWR